MKSIITALSYFVLTCLALLLGVLCISCSDGSEEVIDTSSPVFLSYGAYGGNLTYGEHNEPADVVIVRSEKEFDKYRHFYPGDSFGSESFDFRSSSLLLILGIHSSSLGKLKDTVTKQGRRHHIQIVFEHRGMVLWALTPWYIAYKVPRSAKASDFEVEVATEWKE